MFFPVFRRWPSGLKSGASTVLGVAVPAFVYIATTPFLLRSLGNAEYGILMLFLSMTALLGNFDLGLGSGGVLSMGRSLRNGEREAAAQLNQELFSIFLISGAVIFGFLWIAAAWVGRVLSIASSIGADRSITLVRIASAAIFFSFLSAAIGVIPKSLERFPQIALIQTASRTIFWAGTVALLLMRGRLEHIFYWTAVIELLELLIYIDWNSRLLPEISFRPTLHWTAVRQIVPFSSYAFLSQLCSAITYHGDKLLIAHFLGPVAVAYYLVATGVSSKLLILASSLTPFVFPRAVALHSYRDREELRRLYLRAVRLTLLALAPVLVPAILAANQVLSLWINPAFAKESSRLLQILLVAYFLNSLSVVPSHVFNGMGNSKIGALYSAFGGTLNIVACLLLIPAFGLPGAALAALLGMLQSVVFMGKLESDLGFGWYRAQPRLFLQAGLLALAQLVVMAIIRGIGQGQPTVLLAASICWTLFYAAWFLTPLAGNEESDLFNHIFLGRRGGFW